MPIGHVDSAQTTSTPIAGPTGPSGELGADDLTYQHLGPGHFGIAISPEYPDGERVIWSNGGDRISKLDADSLAVLSELALPGKALQTPAQADAELEVLDREQGEALGNAAVTLASTYLQGLAGVYYALDADNTLYVGGATSIIAYGDDGRDRSSPVTVQREWAKPPDVGGNFVGVNMMFDGHLVLVTDEGWVVAVTRDFASYDAIQIAGAEDAAAHNAEVRGAARDREQPTSSATAWPSTATAASSSRRTTTCTRSSGTVARSRPTGETVRGRRRTSTARATAPGRRPPSWGSATTTGSS